jgi:hypothetical protein
MAEQGQWYCLIQVNDSFATSSSAFYASRRDLLLRSFRTFDSASRGGRCLIGQVGDAFGHCPTMSEGASCFRLLFFGKSHEPFKRIS